MLSGKRENTIIDEGRGRESISFTLKADENEPGGDQERTKITKVAQICR